MATAPKRKSSKLRPCVYVLLAGLPGTGKSALASDLARQLSATGEETVILNKDDVRAALFPGSATDYSDAQNDVCMRSIFEAAGYLRSKIPPPRFILFDGRTFSRSAHIEQVIAASGGSWLILHLVCADEVARQRLAASAGTHPAADRTFTLYSALKQSFEPIERPHLVIDTAMPIAVCLKNALAYLQTDRQTDLQTNLQTD